MNFFSFLWLVALSLIAVFVAGDIGRLEKQVHQLQAELHDARKQP
jgi:hypothetical protein